jgi:hypothetical protein
MKGLWAATNTKKNVAIGCRHSCRCSLTRLINQHGERCRTAHRCYVALRRRYSVRMHNNGRLFLSQRMAEKELNSHHNQIARWYRELQHYGFIVLQVPGCLGVDGKGKAPHWRLTELGYMKELPTRDFTRWDGAPFNDRKKQRAQKLESRARKHAH